LRKQEFQLLGQFLGASAIPTSHPLNVGMVGMHGNYAPNVLTNECDVLIANWNAF
jgi:thiamine pyrophosphate-dependent acetolactate synthase large subunit-like protein